MNPLFKAMHKKKRKVNPDIPRPNLMSHEKVLKDQKLSLEQLQHENQFLKQRMADMEAKLRNQTNYLTYLHQVISSRQQKG